MGSSGPAPGEILTSRKPGLSQINIKGIIGVLVACLGDMFIHFFSISKEEPLGSMIAFCNHVS